MNSAQELNNKVAIITGAAMGIGRACAEHLAQQGAAVVIADRDAKQGAECANDITQTGAQALFVQTDVSKMADMQNLANRTVEAFGRIDILVNNAALAIPGSVHEMTEEQWDTTLSVNLGGVWRAMNVCVPHMIKGSGGSIINISSTQAFRGFKGWGAYAAAKGGINSLTQQTAVDLAPHGIRVNAVAPGTIMTPMNQKIFAEAENPEELIESWKKAHPIGRYGEVYEVAEAVLFLASERSSFITGDILRVDGGQVVKGE